MILNCLNIILNLYLPNLYDLELSVYICIQFDEFYLFTIVKW